MKGYVTAILRPYLVALLFMASSSWQAVMQVEAARSHVYEEPRQSAMSRAHCTLHSAPSAVTGLKSLPAAQPLRAIAINAHVRIFIASPMMKETTAASQRFATR